MSDVRKRKETSSSPEINREKEKILINSASPPISHVSVQLLDSAKKLTTPTKSPTNLGLLTKCKLFEITTSPKRTLDCELLYNVIIGLELRVFKQEEEVSALKQQLEQRDQRIEQVGDDVITELKERLHALETASPPRVSLSDEVISDLDARVQMLENGPPPAVFSSEFITHAKRELPLLSEGLAKVEESISKMEEQLDHVIEDVENFNSQTAPPANAVNTDAALDGLRQDTEDKLGKLTNDYQSLNDGLARLVHEVDKIRTLPTGGEVAGLSPNLYSDEQLGSMNVQMKKIRRKMHLEKDQSEQYSRREILRVTGVPQKQDENTTELMCQIAHSIGVQISPSDISVSHRTGKSFGNNPRPFLVKFVRREVKNQIMQRKKFTRNITHDPDGNTVKIFLDEDLTRMRASVCKKLRGNRIDHYTRDGKVFIKTGENSYKVLDTPKDWEEVLDWTDQVKEEVGVYPKD